jgi:hypothetical protein
VIRVDVARDVVHRSIAELVAFPGVPHIGRL